MGNLRNFICDPAFISTFATTAFALLVLSQPSYAANIIWFCKCTCGANSSILELPLNETKPCALCTKQYCLENVPNGTCEGIQDSTCPSTDLHTACFARDSLKDEIIVYLFLIVTLSLLFIAMVRPYVTNWWRQHQIRNIYSSMPNAGPL
ncbi:hypothetical protein BC937DRAFT_94196 [Endogone sp. FLAS-F59071]|nr:hypothetical protein BC937DRAFT_94196 [Endogone sp. FLAS-F59071]|eukprot:RUS20849.1 hypothetical protein BC937DRAFT_94196 [Endogone sp. FLAS-F59071]